MKRQLTAIGMAMALGAGGVVSAQSDGMGKGQMDKGMMDKDKMAGMSDKDMKAMKLNVKSVKMVSASCP